MTRFAVAESEAKEKIFSHQALIEKIEELRRDNPNIRIGLTNGTFTIPHKGHFKLLEECRKQCDFLVVAMNSKTSVESLGRTNSVMKIDPQRMLILGKQSSVDAVTPFDSDTANELIQDIKPSIYFKGYEDKYKLLDFSEATAVKAYGGDTMLIPTFEKDTFSASILARKVEKLQKTY